MVKKKQDTTAGDEDHSSQVAVTSSVQRRQPARQAKSKNPGPPPAASNALQTPPSSKRKATVKAKSADPADEAELESPTTKRVRKEIQNIVLESPKSPGSSEPKAVGVETVKLGTVESKTVNAADQASDQVGKTPAQQRRVQGMTQMILPWDSEEERKKPFLSEPLENFLKKLERINKQRMFVVGHQAKNMDQGALDPQIKFNFVGSTGNIYETTIGKLPCCTCPDKRFRPQTQCKHIIYALSITLKAPRHLQFQMALLASEIFAMWEKSPISQMQATPTEDSDGNRKPIEGDCPICFHEMKDREKLVWCMSSCGNNVHKVCFDQWAAATRLTTGIRCVYCRAEWIDSSDENALAALRKNAVRGENGYYNVADQFGLSAKRDYSIYSRSSNSQE